MPGDLFQEWRVADRKAHGMEQQLLRIALAFLEGHGPAPLPEDQEKARDLRAIANELFQLAMTEMQSRADRAKR